MNRRNARLRLFDQFSSDLSETVTGLVGVYRCPICLHDFGREDAWSGVLTLEDVIPKKMGPKTLVLTCAGCNNDVGGHMLDSQLHHLLEFELFWRGAGKAIRADMHIQGSRLAVHYERVSRQGKVENEIRVVGQATSPAALKEGQKAARAIEQGNAIKISMPIPSERRARVALLKCAYLMAFKRLGYDYILNQPLNVVRDQIRFPSEIRLPIDAAIFLLPDFMQCDRPLVVQSPEYLRGILIPLELRRRGATWRKGILLPGPNSPEDLYAQSDRMRQTGRNQQMTLAPLLIA